MIGMILFFFAAIGFVVLAGKFVISIADKQEAARDRIIFKEMESAFHYPVKIYSHNDEHDFLNAFLETQRHIFTTNRRGYRPKRYVIEGADPKGRRFIAAVIRNVRPESGGGYWHYAYLYAVRDAEFLSPGEGVQILELEGYQTASAHAAFKGDYVFDPVRYEKLTACIA